jgi:hypothetical protein
MKAEMKTRVNMTSITNGVGPCSPSKLPVFLHNHLNPILIGHMTKIVHPTAQSRMYTAETPLSALTKAMVKARRIQPTTSLPTPAERTIWPTLVSRSLVSVRIRQSTGKAVIEATP